MKKILLTVAVVAILALPVFAIMANSASKADTPAPTAPGETADTASSGLSVGDAITPFHPTHLAGPDKGTDACPPCTYGDRPAVQVWFHEEEEANAIGILTSLHEAVSAHQDQEFKAFGIFIAECEGCKAKVETIVSKLTFEDVGVATVDHTNEGIEAYKINTNPEVKNTVLVYKDKKVVAKLVNVKADEAGLASLQEAISKAL